MPDDNAAILKSIVIYIYVSHINPSITDWVQNVPMLGLFFNSSRWYIATILLFFLFVLWSPVSKDYHYAANILFSLGCCFFLSLNGPLFTHVTSNFPWTKDRERDWKCYQCSEWVCKVHPVKKSQKNMQQLHVTIIIQKNYIHISVPNLFSFFFLFFF
jgi:hypothetical protein